ncbi:MAG: gliding motility-associated C-terminal domain-containing protein [Bacteroidia bacterium]
MYRAFRYCGLILLLLQSSNVFSTHLMGGEITWDCLGNGRYKFFMTLYRDCSDPTQFQIQYQNAGFGLRVHNHPSVTFIPMTLVSRQDITPDCNILGPPANCATQSPGSAEEHIFQSQEILLNGVPPAQGWIFTYSDCCRNTDIFNIDASGAVGMTLRAKMFAYQGANNSPCTDSSPRFEAKPVTVICSSPQPPNQEMFIYNQNASDPDRDSVSYSFATPLDFLDSADPFNATTPVPLDFNPTMSVNSPFPGQTTPGFPNSIPATLDPVSGQISLSVTGIGKFVSVVRVQSFRCGQLIAEIYREIQLISRACGVDNPPQYTVSILDPSPGDYLVNLTVTAGDLVQFNINAVDNETIPQSGATQVITLEASGGAFGTLFTDPNVGCNIPPCATLNPPPPASGVGQLSTVFTWQTACDHVMDATVVPEIIDEECYMEQTSNTFQISFFDDFCPYPAYTNITINVVVEAPPLTPSPELRCLEVLPGAGGDVKLTWVPPADPENQFEAYRIFRSSSLAGPFTEIASLNNIAQTSHTDLNAGAHLAPVYYFISTLTGCSGNILNVPMDTLSTMYLDFSSSSGGAISVNWNTLAQPLPPSTVLPYEVFSAYESVNLNYTLLGTYPTAPANDAVAGCDQFVSYYVRIADQLGCYSVSNVDSGRISTTAPPLPPVPDTVSVLGVSNDIMVAWEASSEPLSDSLYIYRWNGVAWVKRDSASHVNESFKILSGDGPEIESQRYRLVAKDKCKLTGDPSEEHNSLWLDYMLDNCQALAQLEYTPYSAWASDNLVYRIFTSLNGQPYQLYQSINALPGVAPSLVVTNLIQSADYCIYIQVYNPLLDKSSSSNVLCFTANVDVPPQYTYLRYATVFNSGDAYSACLIDDAADLQFYSVLRANWPNGTFDTLVTLPIFSGATQVAYLDTAVATAQQSYTYKYVLYNKCYEIASTSNTGRTILLKASADDGYRNSLNWNTYAEWEGQVLDYVVYKSVGEGQAFFPLSNTGTDTLLIDDVADEVDAELTYCYRILAREGPGNPYGLADTSWSNVVCVTQKPTIFIPTAFLPGDQSFNNMYKPKGLYETLATNFEFRIFNRWGEEVFYTRDTTKAWDGKYKSRFVESGIYSVKIQFDLPDGSRFKKITSVTVLY